MGIEQVRRFLTEKNCAIEVIEFDRSTATVDEAAAAFGVEPGRIAKTLALRLKDGSVAIVVTAGTARLDNKKARASLGGKVQMLGLDEVEAVTGHPVGGVCPFALKKPFPVYLDITLKPYTEVFPAAGAANAALRIAPETMRNLVDGRWADLCRQPTEISS